MGKVREIEMNSSEKIWWLKAVLSIAVAVLTLATQIFFGLRGTSAFMIGVLVYLGLSDILSKLMGVDRSRGLRIGVGAYFFIWFTTWILLYTYFFPV
jgi:hypothetical protein